MARVLILQGHAKEAIEQLDSLPLGAVPPAQLAVLRGRALIGLEKWDDANKALEPSIGLNPDPAEAHYLLGLVHQHNNDFAHAAESFRKAYEFREKSGKSSS
jgi:tetratricopeptide (TPR) repeat protein